MTKLPKPVNVPVVVKVVRVSGTIKKAEMEVIKRAKEIILRAKIAERQGRNIGAIGPVVKAVEKRRDGEVLVRVDEAEEESGSE